MIEQAKRFGARFDYGTVTEVDFSQRPFKLKTSADVVIQSKAVIIATGASPRKLNVKGEDANWGKGVTSCATCDGFFYKKLEVVVVGGGDTMCEEVGR
jgi:thioredoxin reductase (NADPH)